MLPSPNHWAAGKKHILRIWKHVFLALKLAATSSLQGTVTGTAYGVSAETIRELGTATALLGGQEQANSSCTSKLSTA